MIADRFPEASTVATRTVFVSSRSRNVSVVVPAPESLPATAAAMARRICAAVEVAPTTEAQTAAAMVDAEGGAV